MRSNRHVTTRSGGVVLATSLFLALCVSLLLRARPWTNLPSSSDAFNDASSRPAPSPPDLDIIPIEVSPPSNPNNKSQDNGTVSIELSTLPGLGGSTPLHGPWDGHAIIVTIGNASTLASSHPRDDDVQLFSVLAPIGGCTSHSGQLSKTSINAARSKCDVAVNGSPFGKNGGCIGQGLSNGAEVCSDCDVWDGIPSLGLLTANRGSDSIIEEGSAWVVGTGLNCTLAKSMGILNLISGHDPGWLVRKGRIIPERNGGDNDVIAPRTAVGISGDGTRLILLVVDGCEHCPDFMGGPQGLTISELALEMIKLGAVYAINLDGGGSSTLFYEGKVVNYPTSLDVVPVWRERRVSTVLCLHSEIGGEER
mmetsp:Transcript_9401/g.19979  ORF Transcript_9401/g.19979 Transcript_9401/m.19979 type:complete len:366 (+) Transcript_9401:1-1098(+)